MEETSTLNHRIGRPVPERLRVAYVNLLNHYHELRDLEIIFTGRKRYLMSSLGGKYAITPFDPAGRPRPKVEDSKEAAGNAKRYFKASSEGTLVLEDGTIDLTFLPSN